MKLRVVPVLVLAASGWFAAVLASPATRVLMPTPESEPNNTPQTADPLTSVDSCQAASGSITAGDVDYYSFTAPAGARVWALVDTAPSPPGSNDSVLTLFASDGTTVLEEDDDDGTGTDCDGIADNQDGSGGSLSSAIAGAVLPTAGTYFLRVESFAGTISSYKLFVTVTSSAQPEVEMNDTAATANPIVTAGSPIGVRDAAISTVSDVDFYSVVATAGSTLFISVDQNPADVVVDLLQPDGTTVILSVDNSLAIPGAESFCFNVTVSGTYFVRVRSVVSKQTTGNYSLMVAACGLPTTPTATPTRTLTPTVTTTTVVGGPTATPTATRTSTPQGTPQGGPPPSNIPTLSFPMLLLMGLGLAASALLLVRRL